MKKKILLYCLLLAAALAAPLVNQPPAPAQTAQKEWHFRLWPWPIPWITFWSTDKEEA